jgi:hypothetical protein
VELRSFFAAHKNIAEKVLVLTHQYSLSFAVTDFKLQGRTLPKLILSLCRRTKLPHMTLAAFYVLVSRVQRFDGLRLLCHDPKGLEKVSYLQHDAYLYAWECGYDAEARWNDDLAKVALGKIRAKRDAERARKAEVAKAKATREREAKKAEAAKAAKARKVPAQAAAPPCQTQQQPGASRKKQRTEATASTASASTAAASGRNQTPHAPATKTIEKKKRKCSSCGQLGHDVRICPQLKASRKA